MPIQVEWDGLQHDFNDGFGLCSPTRWKPPQRGGRRSAEMVALANATFQLLCECVDECIPNVRGEAFKLVTGKLTESPFAVQAVDKLRRKFSALLPDKVDAMVLDDGQPFFLRALAQWLKLYNDPDVEWLVDVEDSFATGVCVGVDKPLPGSPQVFPPKVKHRKLDDTEFCPIAQNYPSAELSAQGLEEKFREEESLGRMHPSKLGVLREEFGDKLRIASMAAIQKPDGTARLRLKLRWRPREENQDADDLTNENFSSFDMGKRLQVTLSDLDTSILDALVETRGQFDVARAEAKVASKGHRESLSKKFEKSPW
eukprot:s3690_g10.t1